MKANLSKDTVGSMTLPAEWISAGYNGEGMVNAWLCGVALGLMILGREDISAAKTSGRPQGKLHEWFPKEYICYHDTRNRSPEGISPVLGVCVCLKREERAGSSS